MSMTPEDRDLFLSLQREQRELQEALARLGSKLDALATRANGVHAETILPISPPIPPQKINLPPIPVHAAATAPAAISHSFLPPLPAEVLARRVPPPESFPPMPPLPPAARGPASSKPTETKPSFEFRAAMWLLRIGALSFVLGLVFLAAYLHVYERFGPWGKVSLLGLLSVLVSTFGQRIERKRPRMALFGRVLIATGWAGLYVTIYSAYAVKGLEIITSPLLEGLLFLAWAAFVLIEAERRKSQLLAVFAITLAYISTAFNPLDRFTMTADLLLSHTSVLLLLRNGSSTASLFAG